MRILRSAEYKTTPWKNGGGVTTEIAVFPPEAGLDDFLWRVSTARVEKNGPFSMFPGVDRSLSLLDGAGITLKVQGRIRFDLTRRYEKLTFPADVSTEAILFSGPITDLNVMTRRGVYESAVQFVEVSGELPLDAADGMTLLIADGKGLAVTRGGQTDTFERGDALLLEPGDTVTLAAKRSTHVVAVTIIAARPGQP